MAKQTMKAPRITYTDKINSAQTWEAVLSVIDRDDFFKYYGSSGIEIENIQNGIKVGEDNEGYEALCDIIENLLSPLEFRVFNYIVDEELSLRRIAELENLSHEKINRVYKIAKYKVKAAIEEDGY